MFVAFLANFTFADASARNTRKTLRADDGGMRYQYLFMEAMVQRECGNDAGAFDLLRYCTELRPDASEAYFYLAQYYLILKDKVQALDNMEKAVKLDNTNATYLEILAKLYIENNQMDKGTETLEALMKLSPEREDILEMLLGLYEKDNRLKEAVGIIERLERLEGMGERLAYLKCDLYGRLGNKQAAVAEMKKLADQFPNDLNSQGAYGDVLLINDMDSQAKAVYDRILKEDPDNVRALMSMRAYYGKNADEQRADSMTMRIMLSKDAQAEKLQLMRQVIGESESRGGDSTKVLSYFRKAMQQPQADADLGIMYAAYMHLKKMPQDSVNKVLEQVLLIAPENAAARLQLVGDAWNRNDLKRVVELCQAARQYNPEEMAFYYYQGMAYYKNDEDGKALDTFKKGIGVIGSQSDPAIVSDFYAVMGDLYYSKTMYKEAFEAYDSCLQWKDDNYGCMNNYAYYLSQRGEDLAKAERMSYKTIKAEPKNATYLDTYAWILFLQKRYSEAKIYIDQALQNDTDPSADVMEHAGDIYAHANDVEGAAAWWKKAVAKAPHNKVLAKKAKLKKYVKK